MAFYLGVDGGGSKTLCVVGDEISELGRASSEGSQVIRVGAERSGKTILTCIEAACAKAQVSTQEITRTVAGVAGLIRPELGDSIRKRLSQKISGEIEILSDREITLAAAFGNGPGVIVIAGTGSIAYGRNALGKIDRAGGWGYAVGDEGSGYWIGRTALGAALRASEEGGRTMLLGSIAEAWRLSGDDVLKEIVIRASSSPPPDFAALLPTVIAAQAVGDPVADRVLKDAGRELARLANLIVTRTFAGLERVPVAMSGGVFRHCALVRETFYDGLSKESPKAAIREDVVEAVQGALWMARRTTPRSHEPI